MTLWTPSNLSIAPTHWWDAADTTTITLNGSSVAAWANKGSAGGAVSQSSAAMQPTYGGSIINGITVPSNNENTHFGSSSFSVPSEFRLYAMARLSVSDAAFSILGSAIGTFVPLAQAGSTSNQVSRVNSANVLGPQTIHINGSPVVVSNRSEVHAAIAGSERVLAIRTIQPFTAFRLFDTENISFRPTGAFGEILLVPEAGLTQTDDDFITGYLAWKWGVQAFLPANHPHKNAAPTLPNSGLNAVGSGSISLIGSAAAALAIAGQGNGALPIGGSGTVTTAITANSAGLLGLAGLASSSVAITTSGDGTLPLAGMAQAGGAAQTNATATGSIGLTGGASAIVKITATVSGAIGLTGSALAGPPTNGAISAGTIGLGGSGAASVAIRATGAGQLGLAGTGATSVQIRAAAAGSIDLTGAATATERARVPSLIFKVARERRVFTVPREPRLFRVPREQRIFKVARSA